MNLNRYMTILEAKADLFNKGFTNTFLLKEEGLLNIKTNVYYNHSDLQLHEHHRFGPHEENDLNAILFVIECYDGTKGIMVSSFDRYYDRAIMNFIQRVRIKPKDNF
ncbi:MAG: hypothetical protein AB8F74_08710 [Saprospiraceae bacterium]